MVKMNTRYYSNKQEKQIAKSVKGHKVANSGATKFNKGDVVTNDFLIECKTLTKPQKTFTIKKEWLEKNKEESFAMGKYYNALAFNFGEDENYYIIDEKLFLQLIEFLRKDS